MTAVWQEQIDVVTEFAGWSDEELFNAWVARTRVVRGLDPDPVSGQVQPVPPIGASRGVWVARVRELVHAVHQAYSAIDTPAPADPEFCRLFLGAFGGAAGSSLRYRAAGEGAELPAPRPTFDDGATPEERVRLQTAYEQREQRRRALAVRRSWESAWSGLTYVGRDEQPAEVLTVRTWIDWTGRLHPRSLESVDAFLRDGDDIGAHRMPAEPMTPTPTARVSAPWVGADLFVKHRCVLRLDGGGCNRWQDEVFAAPIMEWRLWSEIAEALEARSATDVMRDAWRWTIARNVAQLLASGMATTEVTDMIGQADVDAARIQQENDLREIARWTDVVASAAMAAGPYGAIVGAVLKAIAAIFEAVPIAHGVGLDIWDRRTPAFSRHRITGRPGSAPTQPVELPPGFGRTLRGTLRIGFPLTDATGLRVSVNNGVWRPHHWEAELPVGTYQVDVEQPRRVPSRITVQVRAGDLTTVELSALRRVQTRAEIEAQKSRAKEQEAEDVLREKLRGMQAEDDRRAKEEARRRRQEAAPKQRLDASPKGAATETRTTETGTTDATAARDERRADERRAEGSRTKTWLRRGLAAVGLSAVAYAGWRAVSRTRRTVDVSLPMDQGAHDLVSAPRDAGGARAGARARMDRNR